VINEKLINNQYYPELVAVTANRQAGRSCGAHLLVSDLGIGTGDQLLFHFPTVLDPTTKVPIENALKSIWDTGLTGAANGELQGAGDASYSWNHAKAADDFSTRTHSVLTLTLLEQDTAGGVNGAKKPSLSTTSAVAFNLALDTSFTKESLIDENHDAVTNPHQAQSDAALSATLLGNQDDLSLDASAMTSSVADDGLWTGGDSATVTFSCQMDEHLTLQTVQAAVDAAFGDGVAGVLDYDDDTTAYTITILPGRFVDATSARTLTLGAVLTSSDYWNQQVDLRQITRPFQATRRLR
jgi:hypothetical protein